MAVARRRMLQGGAAASVGWVLTGKSASTASFSVDVGFTGPGLYLYPTWGEPVLYRVQKKTGSDVQLEFIDAATGAVLWVQGIDQAHDFIIKVSS